MDSTNPRLRVKAELDQARQEIALLREQMRIKDVVIVNWHSQRDQRVGSLRHFAAPGWRRILAGYYDGPVAAVDGWLADAVPVRGVVGVMYTTWRQRYGDLEAFAARMKKLRPKRAGLHTPVSCG